jgi:potassium/chloride transporter 9
LFFSGKANAFQDSQWWRLLYGTIINFISLVTCLLGSSLFSMATFFIFILVSFVYLMVVVSFFIQGALLVPIPKANTYIYGQQSINSSGIIYGNYTGFSSATFRENTYANYTIDYTTGETMDFATVFGVFFSSITGLLAGANMSGKNKFNN